ncbi:interferon a3-like isoform X1 [Acanthopagrus latus]|uniref:interferon a3-like isoform X1 n=2 Tax=Acanthopagrus latus TaxID=8177 RepID=UPI00187C464D|nr:interferon a3-like isoform X1 [Acanthopagrus latus]
MNSVRELNTDQQHVGDTDPQQSTTTIIIIIIIIIIMFSWTSLLFVLCSSLTPVLCCDWLTQYTHLSNTSLNHIRRMGGQLTYQQSPVPFPDKLYRRIWMAKVESQLVFVRDSLELISDLYQHDNLSSATWDTIETEHFLTVIDRQIDGLNTCVSTNSSADSRLRKYYRRLETCTVYRTGGSTVSWELIRKETKLHLERLHMLVASIRRRSQQQL